MRDLATYEANFADIKWEAGTNKFRAVNLTQETLKSTEKPFTLGNFALNIKYLLDQVKAVKSDCKRTLKFSDECVDGYLSESSYQHEFMEQNYNHQLTVTDRQIFSPNPSD